MNRKILLRGVSMLVAALVVATSGLNGQLIACAQAIKPQTAVYGKVGSQELTLDVYQPAASSVPLPAVVLIHGGAGSFGDRSDLSEDAEGLAASGYVAFNIDYRLLGSDGSNAWPAQLDDSQLAVRWVRANAAKYNVDTNRICALGHSFGGQLAALLAMRDTPKDGNLDLPSYSSRAVCVIDIAGSVDPTQPVLDATVQPAVNKLMGGTPKDVPDRYRDASPLAQVSANTAPFLIFHGTDDEMVSVEESRSFVDALHKAGVEVIYVEYPHATHFSWLNFFKPGDHWNKIDLETLAFLQRHLHTP